MHSSLLTQDQGALVFCLSPTESSALVLETKLAWMRPSWARQGLVCLFYPPVALGSYHVCVDSEREMVNWVLCRNREMQCVSYHSFRRLKG